jgi:hypothetical protein
LLSAFITHNPALSKARNIHSFLISLRPFRSSIASLGLPSLPSLIRHPFILPAFTLPQPKRAWHLFCNNLPIVKFFIFEPKFIFMASLDEITKAIHNKIKFVSGFDFPFIVNFDLQLTEIRENYLFAFEQLKNDYNLTDIESLPKGFYHEKRLELYEPFMKYYKKTNSWLEKYWTKENDNELIGLYWRFSTNDLNWGLKMEYGDSWGIMDSAVKCLKLENLSEVTTYEINLWQYSHITSYHDEIKNTKGSLDYKKYFQLVLYLISNKRIIKLILSPDNLISSVEHIIQKDLKKIEIKNDLNLYFHYHGLHDPDLLVMDSYQEAVDLRRKITDLRENKSFGNNKPARK